MVATSCSPSAPQYVVLYVPTVPASMTSRRALVTAKLISRGKLSATTRTRTTLHSPPPATCHVGGSSRTRTRYDDGIVHESGSLLTTVSARFAVTATRRCRMTGAAGATTTVGAVRSEQVRKETSAVPALASSASTRTLMSLSVSTKRPPTPSRATSSELTPAAARCTYTVLVQSAGRYRSYVADVALRSDSHHVPSRREMRTSAVAPAGSRGSDDDAMVSCAWSTSVVTDEAGSHCSSSRWGAWNRATPSPIGSDLSPYCIVAPVTVFTSIWPSLLASTEACIRPRLWPICTHVHP
jgi:hypothetical protein